MGVKLAWPLIGFVGFQKSKQLLATESGLFLSSGIPTVGSESFGILVDSRRVYQNTFLYATHVSENNTCVRVLMTYFDYNSYRD